MTQLTFHSLPIIATRFDTANAIVLRFGLSGLDSAAQKQFEFAPGQYLTLRASIAGEDVRRSYSICSAVQDLGTDLERGFIEVGIKKVKGEAGFKDGVFSTFAQSLKAGDTIDVMPPQGRFGVQKSELEAKAELEPKPQNILLLAAGSGITPMLSILKTTLAADETTRFTLVYGNQNTASTMFIEAIQDLKNQHPSRLVTYFCMSRQTQEISLLNGRLDGDKVRALFMGDTAPLANTRFEQALICGPNEMIEGCEAELKTLGFANIVTERFGTKPAGSKPTGSEPTTLTNLPNSKISQVDQAKPATQATLTLILDGKQTVMPWTDGAYGLDVGLAAGLDLPYACKGGVCCTCRAKVVQGEVSMDKYFTLEDWEIAQGYVLSCQCRPLTDAVTLSFDER